MKISTNKLTMIYLYSLDHVISQYYSKLAFVCSTQINLKRINQSFTSLRNKLSFSNILFKKRTNASTLYLLFCTILRYYFNLAFLDLVEKSENLAKILVDAVWSISATEKIMSFYNLDVVMVLKPVVRSMSKNYIDTAWDGMNIQLVLWNACMPFNKLFSILNINILNVDTFIYLERKQIT
jgi:hypothetical protein